MAKAKKVLEQPSIEDFDKKYSYVLAVKPEERPLVFDGNTGKELKSPEYKTGRLNVLLRSSIVWDGSDAEYETKDDPNSKLLSGHRPGMYTIRYYDGCSTLFEDQQPKDREQIEALTKSTREIFFLDGYLHVDGSDVMLKKYLDICSWNADSTYRSKRVQPIFQLANPDVVAEKLDESLDKLEEALALAKKAPDNKMMIHAAFLGVELVDPRTSIEHSTKVVRVKYREMAKLHPAKFVESFNDDGIQVAGWINKAMIEGVVSTSIIPNKAIWKDGGSIICDLTGLKAEDSILNRLVEFAKSDIGIGFKEMLEKLYK